jgi:hypothetical protein
MKTVAELTQEFELAKEQRAMMRRGMFNAAEQKKTLFSLSVMMHPKRKRYQEYFKYNLGDVPIYMDTDNTVWNTCKGAWGLHDSQAEYHVVLQDDAVLTDNFLDQLEYHLKNGRAEGAKAFQFYLNDKDKIVRAITKEHEHKGFMVYEKLMGGVAIGLKTSLIPDMLYRCDKMSVPADDQRIHDYLQRKGLPVYYPIPALVKHRGIKSLIK